MKLIVVFVLNSKCSWEKRIIDHAPVMIFSNYILDISTSGNWSENKEAINHAGFCTYKSQTGFPLCYMLVILDRTGKIPPSSSHRLIIMRIITHTVVKIEQHIDPLPSSILAFAGPNPLEPGLLIEPHKALPANDSDPLGDL